MLKYGFRHAELKVHMFPAGNKQVPAVRVAGDWLRACGFQPGDRVVLAAVPGEIRIVKAPNAIAERRNDELA